MIPSDQDLVDDLLAEIEARKESYSKLDDINIQLNEKLKIATEALEYVQDTITVVDCERDMEKGLTWAESAVAKVAREALKKLGVD